MNIIEQLEAEQVASLNKDIPDFKAGDTIKVGYKVTEGTRSRVQNYEGVCISRAGGNGIAASFTVRKISFGEGVERVFPLHSTNIAEISVVRRGRVRRSSYTICVHGVVNLLVLLKKQITSLSKVLSIKVIGILR